MPLLLSEADVRSVLGMPDLIDAMQSVLAEFSTGATQQPLRTVLQVGEAKSFFGVMPGYVPTLDAMGTKLVTVFESNPARGLPSHLATIVLLDPSTGALRAIVDGRYITEARTGAVSAVAARLLAREDASVLALIGSGVQARSHLQALAHVRALREVRVWSPNAARRQSFIDAAETAASGRIVAATSARDAVEGADLVALVSSAREPVVKAEWIQPGAHLCAVGACRPDQREMDTALVRAARVFVDSRTRGLRRSGRHSDPDRRRRDHTRPRRGRTRRSCRRPDPGPVHAERDHHLQVAWDGRRRCGGRASRVRAGGGARNRDEHPRVGNFTGVKEEASLNPFLLKVFSALSEPPTGPAAPSPDRSTARAARAPTRPRGTRAQEAQRSQRTSRDRWVRGRIPGTSPADV